MRVKCSLCEKLETINDDTLVAKRLRNRPIHTYMCDDCQERIKVKTEARIKTGRFSLYQDPATKEKKKKKGKKNRRRKKDLTQVQVFFTYLLFLLFSHDAAVFYK